MIASNPCLNHESANGSKVVLPLKSTDSSSNPQLRANLLAKAIVRDIAVPEASIQFLFGCTQPEPNSLADNVGTVQLVEELFHSAGINDSSTPGRGLSLEKTLCKNLASSLQDVYRATKDFKSVVQSHWVLQALMPLYLSAGEGKLGDGLRNVLQGLRTLWCVSEFSRVLGTSEFVDWITECHPNDEISTLIEKTFGVSLSDLTFSIWSELHSGDRSYPFSVQSPRPIQDTRSQSQLRDAQWQLVTQFVRGDFPIHVPAEVVVGNVAWDKLISHWQKLEQSLSVRRARASKLLPGSQMSKKPASNHETALEDSRLVTDSRFIEIRSARDPQLSSNLDQLLNKARTEQSTLSILVVKKLDCAMSSENQQGTARLQNWQSKLIQMMDKQAASVTVRGFVSVEGDLSLVYEDVERSELAQWTRESFNRMSAGGSESKLATTVAVPLAAGIATVIAPARSFKIDQLIQSAWRCLEGASSQGAGAVKTIEVY